MQSNDVEPPTGVFCGDVIGRRVELVSTDDGHTSLDPGATGVVTDVGETPIGEAQVWVDWDGGCTLALIGGVDEFDFVDE